LSRFTAVYAQLLLRLCELIRNLAKDSWCRAEQVSIYCDCDEPSTLLEKNHSVTPLNSLHVHVYREHHESSAMTSTLPPTVDLSSLLAKQARLRTLISQHEDLVIRLSDILDARASGNAQMNVEVELGMGVSVEGEVPNTERIYIDLGLQGTWLELNLEAARAFARKKTAILKKSEAALTAPIEQLRADYSRVCFLDSITSDLLMISVLSGFRRLAGCFQHSSGRGHERGSRTVDEPATGRLEIIAGP